MFSDAGESWKTTTSKTKKQGITLNKYLISLTVFYTKSNKKSLYIFKLQTCYYLYIKFKYFFPINLFKYFVYSMDSFRPTNHFFPHSSLQQCRYVHRLKDIRWHFYPYQMFQPNKVPVLHDRPLKNEILHVIMKFLFKIFKNCWYSAKSTLFFIFFKLSQKQ